MQVSSYFGNVVPTENRTLQAGLTKLFVNGGRKQSKAQEQGKKVQTQDSNW